MTAPQPSSAFLAVVQVIPHRIPGGMQRVADLLDSALPAYGISSSVVALDELTGGRSTGGARRTPLAVIRGWRQLRRRWREAPASVREGAATPRGDDGAARPHVVMSHTVLGAAMAASAACAAGVPRRVLVVHTNRGGLGRFKTAALWLLAESSLLTDVVYCGLAVAESFSPLPGRIRRIGKAVQNGISLSDGELSALPPVPGMATGAAPAVLVAAARLAPQKNLALVVEAVSLCTTPVVLRVYGEGPERDELESLASRLAAPVTFYGTIDHEELQMAYADATVFVLPTIDEGLPLVLIEAAAAGLPAIVADRLFNREVLAESGVYVTRDTPQAWAREIDALCSDPARRSRLREAAWNRMQHFGVERMARDYATILRSSSPGVIAKPSPSQP